MRTLNQAELETVSGGTFSLLSCFIKKYDCKPTPPKHKPEPPKCAPQPPKHRGC